MTVEGAGYSRYLDGMKAEELWGLSTGNPPPRKHSSSARKRLRERPLFDALNRARKRRQKVRKAGTGQ